MVTVNARSKPEADWIKTQQGRHFCKCGCGKPIRIFRQHRYAQGIPEYVHRTHRNYHWIKQNQGKPICQCGCGKPIRVRIEHRTAGFPRFIRSHVKAALATKPVWVEANQNKHICACGCGEFIEVTSFMSENRIPRFIHGHAKGLPLNIWTRREQGKHLCICGCGEEIPIRGEHRKRGIPSFILGHNTGPDHPNSGRVDDWIKNQEAILCACGCGQQVPVMRRHFHVGIQRYLHGHNAKGEGNPNWKGGISEIQDRRRSSAGIRKWRRLIWERDGFRCQMPDCLQPDSSEFHAHHIIGFEKELDAKFEIWNGITLCPDCHYSVKSQEGKYEAFFFELLERRRLDMEPCYGRP